MNFLVAYLVLAFAPMGVGIVLYLLLRLFGVKFKSPLRRCR